MGEIRNMPGFPHQQRDFCQENSYSDSPPLHPVHCPTSYPHTQYPMPESVVELYHSSPPEVSSSVWGDHACAPYPYEDQSQMCALEILEEPISKIRFRYLSERGSHGSMSGRNSNKKQKSWPTVRLINYSGHVSAIKIRASLYTEDKLKPHVHRLLGKNCIGEIGDCILPLQQDLTCSFPNLRVLFTEKRRVAEVLLDRKKLEYGGNFSEDQARQWTEECNQEAKDMNLNSIRIQFQAFNSNDEPIGQPVYSEPVHHLKYPDSGELKITRLSRCESTCDGDIEVYLLCEKVNKKDIKVKFFQTSEDGQEIWSDFGKFAEADVHHQVAIVFRTPPYRDRNIDKVVKVLVQLYRQNDGETSESREFYYKPREKDPDHIHSKKRKLNNPENDPRDFEGHQDFSGHQNQFGPTGPDHGYWRDGSGNPVQSDYPMMQPHITNLSANNEMARFVEEFSKDLPMTSCSSSSSSSQDSFVSSLSDAASDKNSNYVPSLPFVGAEKTLKALDTSVSPTSYIGQSITLGLGYSNLDLGVVETDGAAPRIKDDFVGQMEIIFDGKDLSAEMGNLSLSGRTRKAQDQNREPFSAKKAPLEKNQFSNVKCGKQEFKIEPVILQKNRLTVVQHKSEPSRLDFKPDFSSQTQRDKDQRSKSTIEKFVRKQIIPRFGDSLRKFTSTGRVQPLLWALAPFLASQNSDGDNAVHLAIIHQSTNKTLFEQLMPVVSSLMPNDVINHTNNLYQTPLHLAVAVQKVSIIPWLLVSGADPNLQDSRGNTPIHMAVLKRDLTSLSILLEKSHYKRRSPGQPLPNSNILNFDGYSAMHLSVLMGSKSCLTQLIESGALVNIQDGTSGRTPLHLAIQMQSPLVEDLLKQPLLDVDAPDYAGNTPLHLACSLELYDLVHTLISNDANPFAENCIRIDDVTEKENEDDEQGNDDDVNRNTDEVKIRGQTPMDIASENEKLLSTLRGTLSEEERKNLERVRRMSQVPEPEVVCFLPTNRRDSVGVLPLETKIPGLNSANDSGLGDSASIMEGVESLFDSKEQESLVTRLCQLLDPPSTDWEKLAILLFEDQNMVNSIRKLEKSPTLALFKKIKSEGHNLKATLDAAVLSDVYLQLPENLQKVLNV